ncbi:MAG: hypothetical protein NTX64_08095 [Elusimicrobia bacterium]|nr:hypothetical protein [Elusimicrobiota bacterium]
MTNSGGAVGTVTGALFINVAPGSVSIKDNLFRPVQGGRATINLTTFDAGRVTARLYTVAGAFVATLFDADVPKGGTQFQWNGSNSAGAPVASGLYLLRVTGPKIHVTEKIVVVK